MSAAKNVVTCRQFAEFYNQLIGPSTVISLDDIEEQLWEELFDNEISGNVSTLIPKRPNELVDLDRLDGEIMLSQGDFNGQIPHDIYSFFLQWLDSQENDVVVVKIKKSSKEALMAALVGVGAEVLQ